MVRRQLFQLRRLILTGNDLREPVDYFLRHIALHPDIRTLSQPSHLAHLGPVLRQVAEQHFGRELPLTMPVFLRVKRHGFWHGSCRLGPHMAQVIYFEDIDTGIVSLVLQPPCGRTELFRFSLVAFDTPPDS